MAASRPQRANAGNKIAQLLEDEQEDDFYKTSVSSCDTIFVCKSISYVSSMEASMKSRMTMIMSKLVFPES